MKRALVRYRKSAFGSFVFRNQKYAPVLFFMGGFIFDTLTLGRIDRVYDTVVLCSHMTLLSVTLYLYNSVNEDKWEDTLLSRYSEYFPLAIQFFFGALSSAFVIYFFRSVSMSKTMFFFILLVAILHLNKGETYNSPSIEKILKQNNVLTLNDFEINIVKFLANGFTQDQIQQELKSQNIKPSSKSAIEKRLKELREEFSANTNPHLISIMKDLQII